jgi:hypothetical protein
LLSVTGTLAKDDGTLNVIAEEVLELQCGMRNTERGLDDRAHDSAFAFLRALRQNAPDSKDWG